MVRNPRYWRSDRPLVEAVTIKGFRDPQTELAQLEAGTASIVQCSASDVQRLRVGSDTTAVGLAGSGSYEFLINARDEPFSDRRVRQAISLAMDRRRFTEALMYGLTDPTYTMWIKHSPVWDAAIDQGEFNLDRARELLAEAGYPNGFHTILSANGAYPELTLFGQVVQQDLAKIGVRLDIQPIDAAAANTLVTQAKFPTMITHATPRRLPGSGRAWR